MRFIIWSSNYSPTSGGTIVLHKLCDLLNRKTKAFVLNASPSPYNAPPITAEELTENDVIIYPERVSGNPLNAKKVVRWILNKPGLLGGGKQYGEKDLILAYHAAFYPGVPELTVFEIDEKLFCDPGGIRQSRCFTVRNGKSNRIPEIEKDAVEITRGMSLEEVAAIFKQSEFFFSYDTSTMLLVLSGLCGCTGVLVGSDLKREEFVPQITMFKYGVAIGIEDVPWARQTQHLMLPYLKELQEITGQQIDNLIKLAGNL